MQTQRTVQSPAGEIQMPFKVGELLHQFSEMKGIICFTKMDFIVISAPMIGLGLSLRERTAFAIIYSFSQEDEGCWWGSLPTMARWLDCSKRHAIEILKRLQFHGLIDKRETFDNGVKRCIYYATPEAVKLLHQGGELSSPGVVNSLHRGGELTSPNNKGYSNKDKKGDNIYTPTPSKFDFYKALLEAGVNSQTAADWLVVRKAKRCVNSEIAWQATIAEIRKSGYSAEYCIREAVVRSWAGFKAEWLEREESGTGPARARKVDNITYMLEQRERRMAAKARQQADSFDINDLPDEQ